MKMAFDKNQIHGSLSFIVLKFKSRTTKRSNRVRLCQYVEWLSHFTQTWWRPISQYIYIDTLYFPALNHFQEYSPFA